MNTTEEMNLLLDFFFFFRKINKSMLRKSYSERVEEGFGCFFF